MPLPPPPLPPLPRGAEVELAQAASLCQAWTQRPPTPQEGPAQWENWCWVMRATYLTGLPSGQPFCGLNCPGWSHSGWPRCVKQPTVTCLQWEEGNR